MRWQAVRTVASGGSASTTWLRIRTATGLVNMTPSFFPGAHGTGLGVRRLLTFPGTSEAIRGRLRPIGTGLGEVPPLRGETIGQAAARRPPVPGPRPNPHGRRFLSADGCGAGLVESVH